ncbi:hypothetical protein [Kushneria phosphatilytica]
MSAQTDNDTASRDRLNPVVFYGSVIGIVVFSLWTMIDTERGQRRH